MTQLAAFAWSELIEASSTLASLGEARSERARWSYLDVVRGAIAAADGREVASTEDGMLAVFTSATDALTFAHSVQRTCERESRRANERLDVRIGIEVGEVAADETACERALAAIRARQLARAAPAGSVLVSGVVAVLAAATDARLSPAGLLDLPESKDPVAVFEAAWDAPTAVQAPLPSELEAGGSPTSFVGRTAEQERLRAVWERALRGERQLAFVVGEPGIGKTRLASELARELHAEGAAVLWGRSFEEALTPYQPFVQALQHHVRSASADDLREQVGLDAALLARLLPELGTRLPIPTAPVEVPESERYRLFEAIGRLVTLASVERPTLLVLDDLQWADQGTLLLLKHLTRDPAPASLLVLGTYRHSEVGRDHPLGLLQADIERDRVIERIELRGLGGDEVSVLVSGLIGWQPPATLAESLRGETEGNPFFLEEVVRHLEQLGLGADPERLAGVQSAVRELGVPGRVRELVGRRVHRLSEPTRAALLAAAVIGSEFDREVLADVLGLPDEHDVDVSLDEAVEAALLVESPTRIGRYGFGHALVQQALYDEQTLNRRATLHAQVAETLERLRGDAPEILSALSFHYAEAGERYAAKVVRYGRAAGEHALGLFAFEDAARDLSRVLASLDLVGGDDPGERAEVLTLLGTAQSRAGNAGAARAVFQEAAELSEKAGAWKTLTRAALGFGYGGWVGFGGIWESFVKVDEDLVGMLERALEACPAGDSYERVRLLGRLAQALYWSPETERALRLSDEALGAARRLDDPASLAYALDSRNVVLWGPDNADEGRSHAEEMLAIGRALADRDIQLEALLWLIPDALKRGTISIVDELIDEYARIGAELRQPYHLWFTEVLRTMRAHLDGRFDEAVALSEHAFTYGEQANERNAFHVHTAQASFLWLDQGRAAELLDELEQSDVDWGSSPIVPAVAALAFAGLDRREEALAQVAAVAEQGFASIPRDALWEMAMVSFGRAVGHFDDPTHADELYELLVPFADRVCVLGGAVLCLGPTSRILGMLARAGDRPDVALEHFGDALERSRALGSPPLVARTQLEAAKAHARRGAPGDEQAAEHLLDEARATADGLGMQKLGRDIEALQATLRREALA
jgi:tetratricopeptide (TPR) repeat protein